MKRKLVGVIGPNGAGKSTFTNVVARSLFTNIGLKLNLKAGIFSHPAMKRCQMGIPEIPTYASFARVKHDRQYYAGGMFGKAIL